MSAAPEVKYSDRDLRRDDRLMPLAVAYVMAYTGEFEPLLEAKEMLEDEGELTIPVARKVLNCMRHDAKIATSLPRPNSEDAVVLDFVPPPRKQNRIVCCNKQCDSTESHDYHNWGDNREHACTGVPWAINRSEKRLPVTIKVKYAASYSGILIHDVSPTGPHVAVWHGPRHAWGYRSTESDWYDSDADLIVKLACKFPSYIRKPILIREEHLDQYMEIDSALMGLRRMKMCPHCAKLRENG